MPQRTPEEIKARVAGIGAGMLNVLKRRASKEHSPIAELSHIAAVAAARLDQATPGTIERDLAAVQAMLREIQNAGHQAYLAQHGSEGDYQAIGAKVGKRYRTPGGKWRTP